MAVKNRILASAGNPRRPAKQMSLLPLPLQMQPRKPLIVVGVVGCARSTPQFPALSS